MSRQERRALKRAQAKMRKRKKKAADLSRKEISQRTFQVAFASVLMAVHDLYPETKVNLPQLTKRINEILAEVGTVGNKEYELYCAIVQDEFNIRLKGI